MGDAQERGGQARRFELAQNSKTMDKYRGIFAGFNCYMMCTGPREDYGDERGKLGYF